MKKVLIISVIIFGLIGSGFAYPIAPRSLRQLVIESKYIISGFVITTYENKLDRDFAGSKIAKIAIIENLQGNVNQDTIEIEFEPNMICPTPAMYYDSTYVVAFIEKNIYGKFVTHALNYGSKKVEKDDLPVYKMRIIEMQEILKTCDANFQFNETIEWLVKCAEHECTRIEGTSELGTESRFIDAFSKKNNAFRKNILNKDQKDRLKKALLNSEITDFTLVDLVYEGNEKQLDYFLLEKFKSLKQENYWTIYAYSYMKRIMHLNNSREIKRLLKEFEKNLFEVQKNDEMKIIAKQFISLVEK